uniref:AAA+ ATPase domain-containing protein n=1 Tax=Amphilophus citrinellus TaxID=61819 RepID=A0A3Q0T2P6_AMPCI
MNYNRPVDRTWPVSGLLCWQGTSSLPAQTTSKENQGDIISNSDQISSGPPAVYQLRPEKEEFGTLTRMTVGEKNVKNTNKTILLVGETGAGKSTLINALINYSMGVKFEDEVWFKIVEEEKKSQTESQTSDVIVYEIFGYEGETLPYSLTIIDTPGYGDTRGTEHDDIISQKLLDLFKSVHKIHAVGLVMKATDNRLSDQPMYVFDSVMSLFGKDLETNTVSLITHSNGRRPKNALEALEAGNMKCAKNEKNEPVYFLFDNCQHEDRTEEEKFLKDADEISERGMKEFTDFLGKTAPQKLEQTVEVMNERIKLKGCIQKLQEKIKLTDLKQTDIKHTQEALKKNEEEMKKNEEFTVEVDEVYKEKECIDGRRWWLVFYEAAVCCTVCEENCHYPCRQFWKPELCKVMKGGHCTVCTGKCSVSDHVREKWRYETKTRKVKKTVEEMKLKYEKNKTESEGKSSLLENLVKEMKQLTAERFQLLDESYQHVIRLEQIAMKADSVSTFVHLDFLIEKMKEEGDTEKIQKLEEMRSRVDEGTRAALQYKQQL